MALTSDRSNSFDLRYKIRGPKPAPPDIILITIRQSDVTSMYAEKSNLIRPIKELADITDGYYWDKKIWKSLLEKILAGHPRSVGVTFSFGENVGRTALSESERQLFTDPRVIWAASLVNRERSVRPAFVNATTSNIGISDLFADEDGVLRRIGFESTFAPHLAQKLVSPTAVMTDMPSKNLLINFTSGPSTWTEFNLSDVLLDQVTPEMFKDKIVFIGSENSGGPIFQTPLGPMTRSEALATVTENVLHKNWISRMPLLVYIAMLFLLMMISVFILMTFPQLVSFAFLSWTFLLLASFSVWIFDTFYLWTPVFSPMVQMAVTWVIFVGYQTARIEQQNWKLQQEQDSLRELEQLKNNFISLISHDLKTPLAKIQAVIDRLLMIQNGLEFRDDLMSVRKSSEELLKYIQSILNLLRVESRDFKIRKEVSDINEIIEEALQQIGPLARERQITVQKELEPIFSLEFDVTLIKEVLINLIENAVKYTSMGGRIHVSSQETDSHVRVQVSDTGEGISEDDLQNIWGKFVRGKNQDLRTKGTGLGLYLVKYFIELHGGRVELKSELGRGTDVIFYLPFDTDNNVLNAEVS